MARWWCRPVAGRWSRTGGRTWWRPPSSCRTGLVLDGELVVWDAEEGLLSFQALQRRAAARARGAAGLAVRWPAYFVAFAVLQLDGEELPRRPYRDRRTVLEKLFNDHSLTAPWTLCPMTTDLDTAREWLESWTDVSGVEGIVLKPLTSRYRVGYRGWTKIRRRDTTEAITGAATGTLTRPGLLILARLDAGGRLRAVGRTVPLRPEQSRQVGEHLVAADPGHPWTGVRFTASWGATSWTPSWSAPGWWPRSAQTGPSTAAESSVTRCGSSGCAWTSRWRTCRGSGRGRQRPLGERSVCGVGPTGSRRAPPGCRRARGAAASRAGHR
ncbi:ATP-dependent DNA ligase [Streptomyces sp. NPDC012746]|uniref:ATP-dependent DNA ligase n=1 Tax=Streptomyces sp. NPDC012746 TaxID=3364845 RepID=UPI0036CD8DAC